MCDLLLQVLQDDLDKLWASISKPPAYTTSLITDFFDVSACAYIHTCCVIVPGPLQCLTPPPPWHCETTPNRQTSVS
jgi:hypothetical protein